MSNDEIIYDELTVQEETILLLTKVLENYPGISTELVQEAYIDACLEINMMSEPNKQSLVDEKIEMVKRFQESEFEPQLENSDRALPSTL